MMGFITDILHWAAVMTGGGLVLAVLLARWFHLNSETDTDKIAETADSFRVTAHEQKGT